MDADLEVDKRSEGQLLIDSLGGDADAMMKGIGDERQYGVDLPVGDGHIHVSSVEFILLVLEAAYLVQLDTEMLVLGGNAAVGGCSMPGLGVGDFRSQVEFPTLRLWPTRRKAKSVSDEPSLVVLRPPLRCVPFG